MKDTIEKILNIIDQTHDGVLSLSVLRKNGIKFTNEISATIHHMIKDGILVRRDTVDFSAERPDNTKSVWGEQKNFNRYIHLKSADVKKITSENSKHHGLCMIVMDDIGCCINSVIVETERQGKQYFHKYYDDTHSFTFVVI